MLSRREEPQVRQSPKAINHKNGKVVTRQVAAVVSPGSRTSSLSVRNATNGKEWLKGLDGRKIASLTGSTQLSTRCLQGAGAVVMKQALVEFHFDVLPKLSGWSMLTLHACRVELRR